MTQHALNHAHWPRDEFSPLAQKTPRAPRLERSRNLALLGRAGHSLALCLMIAVLHQTAFAQTGAAPEETKPQQLELEQTIVELAYGRHELSDPRYKKVYQAGREIYSLEAYQGLYSDIYHNFGFTVGIRRFVKKGQATLTLESTQLLLVPGGLGFRYVLNLNHFVPWIEVGADYVYYRETSDLRSTSGSTLGYHLQAGFYLEIPGLELLKLKIYARHSRASAEENGISVNLGGLEYGIGLALGINLF